MLCVYDHTEISSYLQKHISSQSSRKYRAGESGLPASSEQSVRQLSAVSLLRCKVDTLLEHVARENNCIYFQIVPATLPEMPPELTVMVPPAFIEPQPPTLNIQQNQMRGLAATSSLRNGGGESERGSIATSVATSPAGPAPSVVAVGSVLTHAAHVHSDAAAAPTSTMPMLSERLDCCHLASLASVGSLVDSDVSGLTDASVSGSSFSGGELAYSNVSGNRSSSGSSFACEGINAAAVGDRVCEQQSAASTPTAAPSGPGEDYGGPPRIPAATFDMRTALVILVAYILLCVL